MKNKASKTPDPEAHLNSVTQRILREGALILSFLLGLFLLIALLSYSPTDPGFTTTGSGGEVENAVGQLGAWISDLLFQLFGYFAYLFPLALVLKAASFLRHAENPALPFSWAMFALKTTGIVLLAVGAEPNAPPGVPGLADHAAVLHPEEALADTTPRRHVLVLGGGPEGCEVADALAHRPERPDVSVVELRRKVGLGLATSVRALLEERLVDAGVALHTGRTVSSLDAEGVTLADRRGRPKETLPAADLVVVAIGVHPADGWDALADDPRVQRIGDSDRPATILEAVAAGWRAGRHL